MLTKRTKAYLVAIGVGCLALGVDRFMLNESITAPQETEGAIPVPAMIPEETSNVARVPIPTVPFPRNLPPFDPTRDIRDVFVRPSDASAGDHGERTEQQGPKTVETQRPSSAAEFADRHTLNALLDDDSLRIAVVDGRWLKIGDTFDDCRLTTVSGTAASFQCTDGEAILDITDAAVRVRD